MLKLLTCKRKRGGFTLLELLMVVIIIAILASIALPQYIRATEKARASEAIQFLGVIRAAEERYRAQSTTNVYTNVLLDLDSEIPATQYWGNGTPSTMSVTNVQFMRAGGAYNGQTIGIVYNNGKLCGTYDPVFGNTNVAC